MSKRFCWRCKLRYCDCADAVYIPTPEQIKLECQKIQEGWTATEEFNRRVGRGPKAESPYTIPWVRTPSNYD